MVELVSTTFGALAVSLAANSIYDAGTSIASRQMLASIRQASENGKLPTNGDIDRGVQRAAVVACDIVLENFKVPIQQIKRANPAPNEYYASWAEQQQDHFLACVKKIRQHRDALHPNKRISINPFTRNSYQKALKETRINFKEDGTPNPDTALDLLFKPDSHDESLQDVALSNFSVGLVDWAERYTLSCGNWSAAISQEAQAQIHAAFHDSKSGWMTSFRLTLSEEIKSDPRLYKIASLRKLTQLESGQANITREIEGARQDANSWYEENRAEAKKIAAYLERVHCLSLDMKSGIDDILKNIQLKPDWIREELKYKTTSVFNNPPPPSQDLASFHYWTDTQCFLGREDSKTNIVDNFLNAKESNGKPKSFAWAAVAGRGGVGKSRLAKHIYEDNEKDFPISGFVRREFLKFNEVTPAFLETLGGNVFFIVDYVSSVDPIDFVKFMNNWAKLATEKGTVQRVRILLLLRSSQNPILPQLLGGDTDIQRYVTENYIPLSDDPETSNKALTLTHLGQDKTAELMENRMKAVAKIDGTKVRAFGKESLIAILKKFDPEMRPLIAAVVAEAIQKNDLTKDSKDMETARYRLFLDLLIRQRTHRWKKIADRNNSDISTHEMATAFSTVVRGLIPGQVCNLQGDEKFENVWHYYLPEFEGGPRNTGTHRFDPALYSSMIDLKHSPEGEMQKWSFLEPDLIGECLVIAFLNGDRDFSCGNNSSKFLREATWMVAPEQTAFFISLASQDYPNLMLKANWMLPQTPQPQSAQSQAWLLYNLTVDYISKTAKLETPLDVKDIKHLQLILKQFDGQLQDAAEEDVIVADYYGLVLRTISEHCANRINPNISVSDPNSHFHKNASEEAKAHNNAVIKQEDGLPKLAEGPDYAKKASQLIVLSEEMSKICLETIKNCYDRSLSFTLDSRLPLKTREIFSNTLRRSLGSFYWKYRDGRDVPKNRSSDGRAHISISKQDINDVVNLVNKLEENLERGLIDDVSIAAVLVTNILYSELYNSYSLPEKIVEKSLEYVRSDAKISATNYKMLTGFLRNYHIMITDEGAADLESKRSALKEFAGLIVDKITTNNLIAKDEPNILSNLINVISNLYHNVSDEKKTKDPRNSLFSRMLHVVKLTEKVRGFEYDKSTLTHIINIFKGHDDEKTIIESALVNIIENQKIIDYDFLYDRENDDSHFIVYHLMFNDFFTPNITDVFDKKIIDRFEPVYNRALSTIGLYLPLATIDQEQTEIFERRFKIESLGADVDKTDDFQTAFCALCGQFLFEGQTKKVVKLLSDLWQEDYSKSDFFVRNCLLTVAAQLFDIGEYDESLSSFGMKIFAFGKRHAEIDDIISMPKASQLDATIIDHHDELLGAAMGAIGAHAIRHGETTDEYILKLESEV